MAGDPPGLAPAAPSWSEGTIRALTLHSGDIVSLLDATGRLLYNSPAAERISGFTPAELAGVDTFQLIHPDDQEEVARMYRAVVATPGAVGTVQYRYRTKAGGWTWMEAVASNQLDNPEVRGVVANSRDISERRRAEEERARLEAHLVHRQRLEGLGTLAGGIAHDFNNLLAALSAHVALAEDLNRDPAVGRELLGAREALARAGELVRQLLGFARRQPVQAVPLDLAAAVERLRPLLERLLGGRIAVALALPPGPAWILADPAQLEQVVVNLATNARDAMPEGGRLAVEVALGPPGPGAPQGEAVLTVTDTGAGIAPEHLPRVFEPFFTTKEVGRGSGLGLSVTHGIVTQAGGTIRLESAPGRGTTAVVRFPGTSPEPALRPPPGAPSPAPPPERPALRVQARPGERVLLADDDGMVRLAARRVLTRLGWEVDEAEDGLEALERVRAAPGAYAAAVLDVRMPGLGGLQAAERLAGLAPRLGVVLVSGYADEAVGHPDVLSKPYELAELGRRVRRAIDAAAAR